MDGKTKIYTEKQRTLRINAEKKRLAEIFKDIETSRLKLVENLITEAAFQRITLEETRRLIEIYGVIEEYQNGANQKGVKKSSAVEVYDKLVNTYAKIVKQLCDLVPEKVVFSEDEEADPAAELMDYVQGLKK